MEGARREEREEREERPNQDGKPAAQVLSRAWPVQASRGGGCQACRHGQLKMCHSAPRPGTEPDTEQVPNTPVSGGAARTVPHRPWPCGDLHSSPVPLNMAEMGSKRQAMALRRTFHLQLDR